MAPQDSHSTPSSAQQLSLAELTLGHVFPGPFRQIRPTRGTRMDQKDQSGRGRWSATAEAFWNAGHFADQRGLDYATSGFAWLEGEILG